MTESPSLRRPLVLPGAWVISLFLTLVLLTVAPAQEQSPPPRKNHAPSSTQQEQKGKDDHGPSLGAELAKETREAAGEDENAQFKKSGSIKLLARITGLSQEHAYWLAVLLNFAVIAAAITWVSKKFLPGVFRDRTVAIQKAMEEARKASAEARRRLADIEVRLSRLDVEIGNMRAAAAKESAGEEARIKAAAAEDARKIVESAEQEIAAAAKQARRELAAYAADLAVAQAQKAIRVDAETDQALVRGFAEQLSTTTANGGAKKGGN